MKINIPALAFNKLAESLATTLGQAIKDIPSNIINSIKDKLMFTITIDDKSEVYYAFQDWFYEHYEHKFKNVKVYNVAKNSDGLKVKNNSGVRGYQDSTNFSFDIGYSQTTGTYVINHEGLRMTVTKGVQEGDKTMGERSVQYYTLSGTNKDGIKALVEKIYEQYNTEHDQIKIFVSNLYGEWNLVKRITGKTLDNIVMDKDLHSTLVNDISEFEQDKEWYGKLNIPYKRGYLFHGPPGNGKTSLSIAIASEHKRNIYCLDVNKLRDDNALRTAFSSLQAKSLLLIEDVDVAFRMPREDDTDEQKKKKSSSVSVSFACLLNCLDGVYYKEGLLTVMTTNHIEHLDAALIRPGRVDLKVFIPNPGKKEVEEYLSRFYSTPITLDIYDKNIPMAAVQGACITNKHDHKRAIEQLLSDQTDISKLYAAPIENAKDTDADADEEEYDDEILNAILHLSNAPSGSGVQEG